MSQQKITHTVILATLAIGVLDNALVPVFQIEAADANFADRGSAYNPVHISLQGTSSSLARPVGIYLKADPIEVDVE